MAPKTVKVHPELTLIFTEFATDFHQAPWGSQIAGAGPAPGRRWAGPVDYEIVWLARPCPNGSSQEEREHVAVRARVVSHAGVCHGLNGFAGEGKALMKAGVERKEEP